jgi:hypothetical protein
VRRGGYGRRLFDSTDADAAAAAADVDVAAPGRRLLRVRNGTPRDISFKRRRKLEETP